MQAYYPYFAAVQNDQGFVGLAEALLGREVQGRDVEWFDKPPRIGQESPGRRRTLMRLHPIPDSDLQVSPLCLGTMTPQEKMFKFWVSGTDQPYRTSPDGLHWTAGPKPNLPVRWVVYDAADPHPELRFKAFFRNEGFMGVSTCFLVTRFSGESPRARRRRFPRSCSWPFWA